MPGLAHRAFTSGTSARWQSKVGVVFPLRDGERPPSPNHSENVINSPIGLALPKQQGEGLGSLLAPVVVVARIASR